MNTRSSAAIAAARGVGSLDYERRDTATAPTVDLNLDLATCTDAQLADQRTALLAGLSNPGADTDLSALAVRAQAVAAEVTTRAERVTAANAARASLLAAQPSQRVQTQTGAPATTEDPAPAAEQVTLGRAFVQSAEFRAYGGSGRSGTAVIPGDTRALFATANFPSVPTRVPGIIVPNRDTPLTILDLVDRQNLTTQSVQYVQEDTVPGAAAGVAEGAAKPESTWAVSLQTANAETIAHWVNITRQALEDESQIEGYINGRLTFGLLKVLNTYLLSGTGTSPQLRGILNVVGIGTYVTPSAEDPVLSIRKGKTVAQLSEYAPDAVVINPTTWEKVELSVGSDGQFRASVVRDGAGERIWGLRVVVSTNIAAATILIGAFREGATLWERTGVNIYITDSHASNFTSNILTLLAELRAAFTVWRPKAFVRVTLTP